VVLLLVVSYSGPVIGDIDLLTVMFLLVMSYSGPFLGGLLHYSSVVVVVVISSLYGFCCFDNVPINFRI